MALTASNSKNSPKYFAILPAAGNSSRMNSKNSKLLLKLADGKTVFEHSIYSLESSEQIEAYFIACRKRDQDTLEKLLNEDIRPKVTFVEGGSTRQESVRNALRALPEHVEFVLVHDAARPLCEVSDIKEVCAQAKIKEASILAEPVTSTVKISNPDATISKTIEREKVWLAQTPQAFSRTVLEKAHLDAERQGFQGTDEASLVERIGKPVSLVRGSSKNIKITELSDISLANQLLEIDN